jgi:4-hydroxy-tetrahydrodipicolinate synthase
MRQIARLIEEAPHYLIWSGNDEDTFPILSLGGYGVISVISHLVGRQLAEMIRAHVDGRTDDAASVHRRLLPLIDALFCVTNPIPVKYALNKIGFPAGPFRLPMCDPDEAAASRIMAELAKHQVDLPVEAHA